MTKPPRIGTAAVAFGRPATALALGGAEHVRHLLFEKLLDDGAHHRAQKTRSSSSTNRFDLLLELLLLFFRVMVRYSVWLFFTPNCLP